ncbi:MAG: universal stress protein [Solirubrobacterales bacterium]
MSTVLAAIDGSPISRAVLDVAKEVARVLDADVDAVHVVEEGARPAEVEVLGAEIPLRMLSGEVSGVLIAEASVGSVAAIVVGACRAVGAPTLGHVSIDVIGDVRKPVVVVPPMTPRDYELHTVLVPVQGKPASALEEVVRLAENPELHVVILRLLDELSIPAFEDQPYYDVEAWADEFLARWVPGAGSDTAVEVRIGEPEDLVISVTHEVRADLVAIGRRRGVQTAAAPVVLAALERSPVPVVLLPLAHRARDVVAPPEVDSVG